MVSYKVKIKDNQFLRVVMKVVAYRGRVTDKFPRAEYVSEKDADTFFTIGLAEFYASLHGGEVVKYEL